MKKLYYILTAFFCSIFRNYFPIIYVNEQKYEVSKEDFDAAVKAGDKGEIKIKDENTLFFKKEDYDTRIINLEKEHYSKGKKAGEEMSAKELKKALAMEDFEGKDHKAITEEYAERKLKNAKLPVDKKVEEQDLTIKQLRSNLAKEQQEKADIKKDSETRIQRIANDNAISMAIPEKAIDETYSRAERVALLKAAGYDVVEVEGKRVITKDSEIIKHSVTLVPVDYKKEIEKICIAKKWITVEGGKGLSDNPDNHGDGTYEVFEAEMKAAGNNPGSEKFNREMAARIKAKTLKM
jgi:hypothetical protein